MSANNQATYVAYNAQEFGDSSVPQAGEMLERYSKAILWDNKKEIFLHTSKNHMA